MCIYIFIYLFTYMFMCIYMNELPILGPKCPQWLHMVIEGNLWLRPCKMACCHANVSPDMFLAIEFSRSFWNRANPVISPTGTTPPRLRNGYITIFVADNTMTTLHSHPAWILGPRTYLPIMTAWCFGTCFSHNIWDVILPIDFHMFQDGYCTTNQSW